MVLCGLSGMLFTNPDLIRISSLCLCSSSVLHEMLVGSELPVLIQTGLLSHAGIHQGTAVGLSCWKQTLQWLEVQRDLGSYPRALLQPPTASQGGHGWMCAGHWAPQGWRKGNDRKRHHQNFDSFHWRLILDLGRCPGLGSACSLWIMQSILLEITLLPFNFFFFSFYNPE